MFYGNAQIVSFVGNLLEIVMGIYSIKCENIDSNAISFLFVKIKVSYLDYVLCKSEDFNTNGSFTLSVSRGDGTDPFYYPGVL